MRDLRELSAAMYFVDKHCSEHATCPSTFPFHCRLSSRIDRFACVGYL